MSNETLDSYIKRLTELEREKATTGSIIKELKGEIKSVGYDPDAISEVVRRILWDEKKIAKAREKAETARLYAERIGQLTLF